MMELAACTYTQVSPFTMMVVIALRGDRDHELTDKATTDAAVDRRSFVVSYCSLFILLRVAAWHCSLFELLCVVVRY